MNRGPDIFFIGLGIVTVGGLGALGWFGYQSYSQYSDLSAQYEEQAGELRRLEALPLYPEQSNLVQLKKEREAAFENVQGLHKQLLPMTLPLEEITPAQFQDKLRAVVSGVVEKAKAAGVKLQPNFYLGFSQYQNMPPRTEAAGVLDRQLRAVELAVEALLENKVDSIGVIDRTLLPEEVDAKAPAFVPAQVSQGSQPKGPGAKKGAPKSPLLEKYPFQIEFVSDQNRFRKVINEIAANNKQFFVVRPMTVENTSQKVVQKIDPNVPLAGLSGGESAAGGKQAGPSNLHYLVGTEKVKVALRVEMVAFANTLPK